jgi:hypothetical protein
VGLGPMIVAASAAAAPLTNPTLTIASPSANAAPMIHIIASIHGDVIRTLGPVWHCECEALHIASNLFIEHKTLRYRRAI